MSRARFDMLTEEDLKQNTEPTELDILIPQYAENKNELDSYKKICENENNKIKDLMLAQNLDSYTVGKYKATRTVVKKESFNEEQLMNYINTVLWGDMGSITCPYIKMQYTVNWDALEKAIYNGEISAEQILEMDKFKEVKETVTLRVTKKKGEE